MDVIIYFRRPRRWKYLQDSWACVGLPGYCQHIIPCHVVVVDRGCVNMVHVLDDRVYLLTVTSLGVVQVATESLLLIKYLVAAEEAVLTSI